MLHPLWHQTFLKMFVTVLFLCCCLPTSVSRAAENQYSATVSIYFSPDGGCTDAVVRELAAAQKHVLVQAYAFTSAPIAKALLDAHKRGVNVQALLDKSNVTAQYSSHSRSASWRDFERTDREQ